MKDMADVVGEAWNWLDDTNKLADRLKEVAAEVERLTLENYRLRQCLSEIRQTPKLWRRGGAGGQDGYAGLPPAMRLIDAVLKETSVKP